MATATMTSKGQLTVPVEVRRKLNLEAGDRVEFVEQSDGSFRFVPASVDIRELKGMLPPPRKPVSLEEMRGTIARMGARKARAVAGRK